MQMSRTAFLLPFTLTLCCWGTPTLALEEPAFEVLHVAEDYEVRRYQPYIVAEVEVAGDFSSAGDDAFGILAGYIFGENRSAEKMQMTAPVESRAAAERMSMTAPVLSTEDERPGTYIYAFVMERKFSLDTLPEPVDPRIRLREVSGRIIAVRRYSGRWTEANYRKNEARLAEALATDGIRPVGQPVLARFNAPFVPWFLRRNEVQVEIEWRPDQLDGVQPSLSR